MAITTAIADTTESHTGENATDYARIESMLGSRVPAAGFKQPTRKVSADIPATGGYVLEDAAGGNMTKAVMDH